MSTVRMSDQLQRDIAREAINTYDKANPERDIASDMGNKMYDKYLKQKHENMQTFLLSEENVSVIDPAYAKIKSISSLRLRIAYSDIEEQTDYDGNATMEIVDQHMDFNLDVSNREVMTLLSKNPDGYNDHVTIRIFRLLVTTKTTIHLENMLILVVL